MKKMRRWGRESVLKSARRDRTRGSRSLFRPETVALETRVLLAAEPLLISEFMASNSGGLLDQDGEASDWVEVFNPSTSPVSLGGWSLTDNAKQPKKWGFPSVTLEPNAFLVVFASGKNRAIAGAELHTNFRLSADGEYLGLIRPDGSVADAYTPSFPMQRGDLSFGRPMGTSPLVPRGANTTFLVPKNDNLGLSWTQPGFAGGAGWSTKTAGLGYGLKRSGFSVHTVKAKSSIDDLSEAYAALSNTPLQLSSSRSVAPVINYLGTGPAAHFEGDAPFDGMTIGDDVGDFAIDARGTIEIPTSGPWTFGVNSDDGFELELSRNNVRFSVSYPGVRAPGDSFATFNLPEAGAWDVRLVYFEHTGWASAELFAAPGTLAEFSDAFRLVGDTGSNGLAVSSPVVDAALMGADIRNAMQSVNSSIYLTIPFFVSNPAAFDNLMLKMNYDDGFVAYLNGTKVASANAPADLAWNSSAQNGRGGEEFLKPEFFSLSEYKSLLKTGLNVLAIQGLNVSPGDSDFLISPELIGTDLDTSAGRYFTAPTPGTFNGTAYVGLLGDVQFSIPHGFYGSTQNVGLSASEAGALIRYTLDGSTPTSTHGFLYAAPFAISKTTVVRAAAFRNGYLSSRVTSNSYLFLNDIVNQSPNGQAPAGWPRTWGDNAVDYGMDPDIVKHPQYGGDTLKSALLAIPSVSISTDLDNLFNASTGIYANAYGEGRPWERPASVELINPDGTAGFSINAGLRIRGGFSRSASNPKHSFRLFFRGEYDGALEYPMFGDEGAQSFEKLDLRTDQNYSWSFGGSGSHTAVRDVFSRDTQRDMGNAYTRSRYYHLYIDGQYWGMYQSQERSEAAFGATYFGGDEDNFDVIKVEAGPYQIYATDGNLDAWRRLWTAANAGLGSLGDYFKLQGKNPDGGDNPNYEALLDVDNLIDYMLVIFYGGNLDAPISWFLGNEAVNNFYAVRDRTARKGFQFFAHDNEHTLFNLQEDRQGPFPAGAEFEHFNPQWLHQQLMANPEYVLRFADRVQKFFYNGGALTSEKAIERFNARAAQVGPAIAAESARWGDAQRDEPFDPSDWQRAIDRVVQDYLPYRTEVMIDQFAQHGLAPALAAPAFEVAGVPKYGGRVVSGSALSFTTDSGVVYYTTDGTDPRLPGGGLNPNAVQFNPATSPPITLESSRRLMARARAGSKWSPLIDATFAVNDAATSSKLIVTEMHYNPLPPSGNEKAVDAQEFEFIELRNVGPREIDLNGVKFTAGITFDFTNSAVTYLAAGSYVVVVKNVEAFRSRYGSAPLVAGTMGSTNLSNGGETVTLKGATNETIFEFTYDDAAPWPTSPDGGGPSLVRVEPLADVKDAASWRASTETGGSPGLPSNSPPSLTVPSDFTVDEDTPTTPLPIEIGDLETAISDLVLSVFSSDLALVPLEGLVLSGTGASRTLVITPAHDRDGTVTIHTKVRDTAGGETVRSFVLTIRPVNDAPSGTADVLQLLEDEPLLVSESDLLANDFDPDGDALHAIPKQQPQHGTLAQHPDGGWVYTPSAHYSGHDSFTYVAADASLESDEIEVRITVGAVNSAPVLADPGPISGFEGQLLQFQLLATDADTPQSDLRFELGDNRPAGMTIDPVTGIVSWTPANGPRSILVDVIATDGGTPLGTDRRAITIDVANVAPTIALGSPIALASGALLDRLGAFADPGGDAWSATVDYGDGTGTDQLLLNPDKSFKLNHVYTKMGQYDVVVKVNDGDSESTGLLHVSVTDKDTTPPRVSRVRTVLDGNRLAGLTVWFNEALDAARARRTTNYLLTSAGFDRKFGTPDDRVIQLRSAALDTAGKVVTLRLASPRVQTSPYRLTVLGVSKSRGLTDRAGNLLDGNQDKKPGGNYVKSFGVTKSVRARGIGTSSLPTGVLGIVTNKRRRPIGSAGR